MSKRLRRRGSGVGRIPGRDGREARKRVQRRTGAFDLSSGRTFTLAAWVAGHGRAAVSALGRLVSRPVATIATVLAIAVALSLPFVLYIMLDNAHRAMGGLEHGAQLTAYLHHDLDTSQAASVAATVREWDEVQSVRAVSSTEALAEYQQMTGLENVEAIFEGQNPLPELIVITPHEGTADRASLVSLRDRLSSQPEVDSVELDLVWVDRLAAIIETLRRIVEVLFVMLALGILLIVGNTIRLGIESQREEIGIIRLFGATDAFIRRPFLYIGLWHGLIAGGVACLLAAAATRLAAGPVERLVALYSSEFELVGLEPWSAGLAIGAGGVLGLGGAWIAVSRELAGETSSW